MNFALRRNPPRLLELTACAPATHRPEGPCLGDAAAETQFLQRLHGCTAAELKPLLVVVGGFMDGICRRAYAIVQQQTPSPLPSPSPSPLAPPSFSLPLDADYDLFFREHDEGRAVRELVELYAYRGRKIVLVGHSWGGDAAVHGVVQRTVAQVDLLITLDPVSRKVQPELPLANVGHWLNIYVDYELARWAHRSNIVARIGGPWEYVGAAHRNVAMPGDTDHEDALRIFREAGMAACQHLVGTP